jgi:hypothetical protein
MFVSRNPKGVPQEGVWHDYGVDMLPGSRLKFSWDGALIFDATAPTISSAGGRWGCDRATSTPSWMRLRSTSHSALQGAADAEAPTRHAQYLPVAAIARTLGPVGGHGRWMVNSHWIIQVRRRATGLPDLLASGAKTGAYLAHATGCPSCRWAASVGSGDHQNCPVA